MHTKSNEGKKNVDTCFGSSDKCRTLAGSDIKIANNYIQLTAQNVF